MAMPFPGASGPQSWTEEGLPWVLTSTRGEWLLPIFLLFLYSLEFFQLSQGIPHYFNSLVVILYTTVCPVHNIVCFVSPAWALIHCLFKNNNNKKNPQVP